MKSYKVRVGDKWARGGDKGEITEDISKSKSWKKASHAKSHITQTKDAISSRWRRYERAEYPEEHPYFTFEPEVVEFEMMIADKEGWTIIQLPKDPILADLLEERGYVEAATKLRE